MSLDLTFHHSIDEIDADQWNALNTCDFPFLRHEFLQALEQTGCVAIQTGWTPRHVAAYAGGRLCAALPLYEKTHSMGEFVFDFSWADAYDRLGLEYYPKLVNAIPFTPVTGPRALPTVPEATALHRRLLEAALTPMARGGFSSFHCLFPEEALAQRWAQTSGLMPRIACQFRWHNQGFADFEDHLSTFTADKRKKIRRERRRIDESGLRIEVWTGQDMTSARWDAIYPLLADTFYRHGHQPYLSQPFFETISAPLGQQMVLFVALDGSTPVGAALAFRDATTLYGRYWGARGAWDSLHFELCYHQGIDHCIRHGLTAYDPGTQGEHKLARGFLPHLSHSLHAIAHPTLGRAIGDFLVQEARWVQRYAAEMAAHSPLKSAAA